MLYSQNLITEPNKDSYNAAVVQLNKQTDKRVEYLKEQYEASKTSYASLNQEKVELNSKLELLKKLTGCLQELVYGTHFMSLRR